MIAIVVNNIAQAIYSEKVCALVLLDLSAAFDTVDHCILTEVFGTTVCSGRYGT